MSSSSHQSLFPSEFSVETCQCPLDLLSDYELQPELYSNDHISSSDIILSNDPENSNQIEVALYPLYQIIHDNKQQHGKKSINVSEPTDELCIFDTIANSLDISYIIPSSQFVQYHLMYDGLLFEYDHDSPEMSYFDQIEYLFNDNEVFNPNEVSGRNELYMMTNGDLNINPECEASYFEQFEDVYNIKDFDDCPIND